MDFYQLTFETIENDSDSIPDMFESWDSGYVCEGHDDNGEPCFRKATVNWVAQDEDGSDTYYTMRCEDHPVKHAHEGPLHFEPREIGVWEDEI